ncbi:MBL fold metallo-hydrolase [Pseudogemmobacter bohemicus]|uniref:MBL fold metallo-hydrolase n=1 Tax=Pseudogemmobacter bohemicus TaxID=2250708 RepID=UPI001E3DFBF6|nr:MBL fold metallo-hydrolase [Pseudogemmobacter bohemicus]
MRFPAGSVLIRHPTLGDILFDTGYGPAFFDATRPFPERLYRWLTPVQQPPDQRLPALLEKHGARPGLILLSHLHADHVAGLFDIPPAPVITSRKAWEHLQEGNRLTTLKAGCPERLRQRIQSLHPQFIEDFPVAPDALGTGLPFPFYDLAADGSLLAVSLPGHGHGQFGLLLPQTSTGPAFLIADAAWSRQALRDRAPPPDITLRRLGDAGACHATFAALCDLAQQRPDISLWPSHCPEAFA